MTECLGNGFEFVCSAVVFALIEIPNKQCDNGNIHTRYFGCQFNKNCFLCCGFKFDSWKNKSTDIIFLGIFLKITGIMNKSEQYKWIKVLPNRRPLS